MVNNFFTFVDANGQERTETRDLNAANFINCIFDGNNNIEFVLDRVDGSLFNYAVENCMISFNDSSNSFAGVQELDFTNPNYQNIILNGFADFRDTQNEDFIIGENSDAVNAAKTTSFTTDILGVDRTTNPDIGAYQNIKFD